MRFSEEQIADICKIVFDWQNTAVENYAKPELYYAAHIDEIREKNYSLVPSRYIEFIDRDTEMDYQEALADMSRQFDALKKRWDDNEATLVNAFKVLEYGK